MSLEIKDLYTTYNPATVEARRSSCSGEMSKLADEIRSIGRKMDALKVFDEECQLRLKALREMPTVKYVVLEKWTRQVSEKTFHKGFRVYLLELPEDVSYEMIRKNMLGYDSERANIAKKYSVKPVAAMAPEYTRSAKYDLIVNEAYGAIAQIAMRVAEEESAAAQVIVEETNSTYIGGEPRVE